MKLRAHSRLALAPLDLLDFHFFRVHFRITFGRATSESTCPFDSLSANRESRPPSRVGLQIVTALETMVNKIIMELVRANESCRNSGNYYDYCIGYIIITPRAKSLLLAHRLAKLAGVYADEFTWDDRIAWDGRSVAVQ